MRVFTALILVCLAVTSLLAVASAQTYALTPSGVMVDWHVATEWEFMSTLFFNV